MSQSFFNSGSLPSTHQKNVLGKPKSIPFDLKLILANPNQYPRIKPKEDKIYLGQSAHDPNGNVRVPFWLPVSLLSSHLFIAGAIGSGKTTVLFRLIAGAIRWYGTVIVSEAKGGINGGKDGAAFTELAAYLEQKVPNIETFRWPGSDTYFNPLESLTNSSDRRDFFAMICQVIVLEYEGMSGDLLAVVYNAATIAEYILILLQNFYPQEHLTLRNLVFLLSSPKKIEDCLKSAEEKIKDSLNSMPDKEDDLQNRLDLIQKIDSELRLANFFYMDSKELVMTRRGVKIFRDMLDHEDLLIYTEPRPGLKKLNIDDILYHKALVIISQPLFKSSSKIVGPLFLDNFLNRVLQLGPNPIPKYGQTRQKVLVVLDETHRLPVGKIGDAGDYLREFNIGLVEVAPTISNDNKRWEQNKHVYQTLLSLSPGVPALTELMRDRLPQIIPSPHSKGIDDYKLLLGQDNPGVTSRSMQLSGRFTGLLQSFVLDENRRLFWIDFEDELLANIQHLLKKSLSADASSQDKNFVDYALGLDKLKLL